MELVDGSKRVGTNQKPAQLIVPRISDCAVVRSTTDGYDAHVTYSNIASDNSSKDNCDSASDNSSKDNCDSASDNCSKDNCNIVYSNITDCYSACCDFAGFGGCFCVPRRLV